jgi:hypothetical protein
MIASNGSALTDKFLSGYQDCKLSRLCLDVLMHCRVIFNCQIEVLDWPSTYLSSVRIRKLFYSILFNDYTETRSEVNHQSPLVVKEYLRVANQIKIYDVDLDAAITKSLFSDERFLLKQVFGLSDAVCENVASNMGFLNAPLKNFFLILHFWLTNQSGEKCNENYKRAFIVCLIKFSLIDPAFLSIKPLKPENREVINAASSHKLKLYEQTDTSTVFEAYTSSGWTEGVQQFTSAFLTDDVENVEYLRELRTRLAATFCPTLIEAAASVSNKTEKYLNLRVLHGLSEYQAIYMSANYLFEAVLLDRGTAASPLLELDVFFNGSFLHNFIEELQHRVNPNLYIEELLGRRSFFKWLYYELSGLYDRIFDVSSVEKENVACSADSVMTEEMNSTAAQDKTKTKNYRKNLRKKLKRLEETNPLGSDLNEKIKNFNI